MTEVINITMILTILGGLVLIVNVLTQVIKQITWDRLPSSLLAFVLSQIVTLIAFFSYCTIKAITLYWYYIVAAVVVGFFVAYAAMFGFDVLKEKIVKWYAGREEVSDGQTG